MRTSGNAGPAVLQKLPELCYALMLSNRPGSRIVVIRRGERGAYLTDFDSSGLAAPELQAVVDELNASMGVSVAQKEAMVVGSMFGFDAPGADPDRYVGRERSCGAGGDNR